MRYSEMLRQQQLRGLEEWERQRELAEPEKEECEECGEND